MNNKKPKNVNNMVTYEEYKNFGKSIDMNEYNDVNSYDDFTDESKKANKKKADIERHHRMIGAILRICELAGYKVESRIVLRDIKTGKIWK